MAATKTSVMAATAVSAGCRDIRTSDRPTMNPPKWNDYRRWDDDAMWIASEIAWRKARTSAAFCSPTADREQAWAHRPFFAQSVVALGDFVVGKGAVPLIRDGEVVGAVGASGGHPDQDHVAAEAGAARFASLQA